jgi:hypothetical protein
MWFVKVTFKAGTEGVVLGRGDRKCKGPEAESSSKF